MPLPSYAEELKRLCTRSPENDLQGLVWSGAVAITVCDNLDRILRDAEIAELAREHCRTWRVLDAAFNDSTGIDEAFDKAADEHEAAQNALLAFIAKETP